MYRRYLARSGSIIMLGCVWPWLRRGWTERAAGDICFISIIGAVPCCSCRFSLARSPVGTFLTEPLTKPLTEPLSELPVGKSRGFGRGVPQESSSLSSGGCSEKEAFLTEALAETLTEILAETLADRDPSLSTRVGVGELSASSTGATFVTFCVLFRCCLR